MLKAMMDKVEEEEGSKDAEEQEEVMRVEGKVEGEVEVEVDAEGSVKKVDEGGSKRIDGRAKKRSLYTWRRSTFLHGPRE